MQYNNNNYNIYNQLLYLHFLVYFGNGNIQTADSLKAFKMISIMLCLCYHYFLV